jgi:phosphotransacetylase
LIKTFSDLYQAVRAKAGSSKPSRVGIIYPNDIHYLKAVARLVGEGIVLPAMIGPREIIEETCHEVDVDIDDFEIVDVNKPEQAIMKGIEGSLSGKYDYLLKGDIRIGQFIEIITREDSGFAVVPADISHIRILQIPRYHKLIIIASWGSDTLATEEQKIQNIENAIQLAGDLGIMKPKVALLAAVEKVDPAMPVTIEAYSFAGIIAQRQSENILIEGPLSFDVAISKDVAQSKGIMNSNVAGDVDVLVMPDIKFIRR